MRRVRIGIIGAGANTEWSVLPTLLGPDAMTPPDTGAWWSRRPVASSDIRYQAPAQPDIVAIADSNNERVTRVAATARIPGVYGDWRALLRDVRPDALLCLASPAVTSEVIVAAANAGVRNLWVDAPPEYSAEATLKLAKRLEGSRLRLWCARPLRRAAAHRAASQLLERDQIGAVSMLALRWSTPFTPVPHTGAAPSADELLQWLSVLSALDLLLAFGASANSDTAVPVQVMAGGKEGNLNLWLRGANGVTATALFAGADSWSTPLPRLEICGTQGRSIVCEAGRRMWLYLPREAARVLEPPGLTTHVTAANIVGMAEDLKAFLASCAEEPAATGDASPNARMLLSVARSLQLCEAVAVSLREERSVEIEPLRLDTPFNNVPDGDGASPASESPAIPMTLPLQL